MIDTRLCEWLMDNADAPIRYRVARALLKDEKTAKDIESELLENKEVQKWLAYLKPHDPPQHRGMEHGCFDFCLENALPKCVQLGLHGGLPIVHDAVGLYLARMKNKYAQKPCRGQFGGVLTANFLSLAAINDEDILKYMLESLDEVCKFAKATGYDIYLNSEERAKLTGVPKNWRDCEYFIRYEVIQEHGFSFPLIYDVIGLYRLYDLKDADVDNKINTVLSYISGDEFHSKLSEGYGIIVAGEYASGNPKYNGMGWSPHYPGWSDVADYMEKDNVPKLLFFAQNIIKYPIALKTKWFYDLLNYLDKYRTDNGTYLFPKEWLKESQGYAVQGHHVSFGENRRKKNWREIESTFFMQLLRQYT